MKGARGFTLIEVLIALAVIAIVATAVLRMLAVDAATAIRIDERSSAEIAAENVAVETVIAPGPLQLGASRGTERIGDRDWAWRREIVETGFTGLWRIEIAVVADDGAVVATRTLVWRARR